MMHSHIQPRWSVVIPYYNEAKFLPQTLASLIAQELKPFRLILVDNASTDDTAALCRQIIARCPDIDTLHLFEPRPGQVHALECGLARVETEFVAICDADTCYPPHYLRRAQQLFENSGEDVVAVMALGLYGHPKSWRNRWNRSAYMLVTRFLERQCHTGGYGHLFRTDALKRSGGYSKRLWPYVLKDHELMQRIFKLGRSRYDYHLWCQPSPRRAKRTGVRWNLMERLLYHLTWYRHKDWFFYRFLAPRLAKRQLDEIRLRERTWT